jgi:sugar lactone lactonase YvrE
VATTFASGFATTLFGLAIDAAGNLYAVDGTSTVGRVGPGGGVATTFASGYSAPDGMTFDSAGNLYVVNAGDNTVKVVGPGGGVATTFSTGPFDAPRAILFVPDVAVPEPASAALMGVGVAVVAGAAWRKRRAGPRREG